MNEKTPTPESLLAHAGWLKGLALRLVKDASQADDVVQQTLLQAIRRPPRDAERMSAWLARVARNEARQMGRSERARGRREQRVGRPRSAQPTVEIVERAELKRRLVDAVFAIEEPFRTAMLQRYVEGHEPKAIAEKLGWAPATVRTRLKRGLDRLRHEMDTRSDGDRRGWTLSLIPLVDPRQLAAVSATSAAAAATGVIVTTKSKLIVLAAVLLLAIGAIVAISLTARDDAHEDESGTPATADDDASGTGGDPHLEGRLAKADTPASTPAAPSASESEGPRVRLRFTDGFGNDLAAKTVQRRFEEAGLPPHVMLVSESILSHTDMSASAIRMMTGSQEGRVVSAWSVGDDGLRLELEPGSWRLYVARPGAAPLLTEVFETSEDGTLPAVTIPLSDEVPTQRVRLLAADTGDPLAGARVVPYFEFGDDLAFFPGPPLVADGGGELDLPRMERKLGSGRSRGVSWWVQAQGRAMLIRNNLKHESGAISIRVPRTAAVEGKAWRQDGQSAAGLEVMWAYKGHTVRTTVGKDGAFHLRGVPAYRETQQLVLVEDAASMRVALAKIEVMPGQRTEGVVIGTPALTAPRAVIHGTISAGGHPIEGAMIIARPAGKGRKEGPVARSDADGRYRIVVGAGENQVQVYFGGADDFYVRSDAPLDLELGEERQIDFALPGGALRIKLVDAVTGKPIRNGSAYAAPANRDAAKDRFPGFTYRAGSAATADADGAVLLRALVPGESHTVRVRAEGYERLVKQGVLPSGAGEEPVELTLRLQPR